MQLQLILFHFEFVIAYIRDATGASTSVKGIRLNFCDVNWRPPQTMVTRKILTDTVTASQPTKTKPIQIDGIIFWTFSYTFYLL